MIPNALRLNRLTRAEQDLKPPSKEKRLLAHRFPQRLASIPQPAQALTQLPRRTLLLLHPSNSCGAQKIRAHAYVQPLL
jgi:hypothetical protein